MPLPQQVIEQLNREPETSHGWASGAMLFAIGIFVFVALLYCGMKFAYEPYVSSQITQEQDQVSKAGQSISVGDEQQIVSFYSQIANLKTALAGHTHASLFLDWLQKHTEANVYYQNLDLTSGNRVTIKGIGKSEADVNQQIAIFEGASEVTGVVVTNVSPAQSVLGYQFDMTLTMASSVFLSGNPL